MHGQSEVARMYEQLSRESQALREAIHGPRLVAQHQMIAHAYDALGKVRKALIPLVGEEHAIALCYISYNDAMEQTEDGEEENIKGIGLSTLLQPAPMQELQKP